MAVLLGSAGCGSGGGGGSSSGMSIMGCSLQCNDSAGSQGSQISCGVTNVAVNQEIRLTFTTPIDPTSVSNNSFQLTQSTPGSGNGSTPAGGFALDPLDPRTLIYRPQLTFDSAGNAVFGLIQGRTYQLKVPGTILDPPPYIRNVNGTPNTSRLFCSLVASEPVRDSNPGKPRASFFVLRKDNDGDPSDGDFVRTGEDDEGVPIPGMTIGDPKFFNAIGATRVHRNSPIRIEFDDVMNPDLLANPVTRQSSFINGFVDSDGDPITTEDQVPMLGQFTLTLDQVNVHTTVVFQPSGGLPSAGSMCPGDSGPDCRKVVVELLPQIADLGGNTLVNAGRIAFTPEKILFDRLSVSESFGDLTREDPLRTGSSWGSGTLGTGPGGGSGRLGDLVVLPQTIVELDTDSEDFASLTNPAMFNPIHIIDRSPPAPAAPALPVVGGVFEFSRLRVDAGGILRFKGSKPARVYVRGIADIAGLIDVSGLSGTLHTSDEPLGGLGGTPGPNGGAGGRGGARPDGSRFTGMAPPPWGAIGGVANVANGPSNVLDPATYEFVNGVDGGGIAFPSTFDPMASFVAGGKSGLGWPQPTALYPQLHMPFDVFDVSGMVYDGRIECTYPIPSSPGAGGGHALDGQIGDMTFVPFTPMPIPPDSAGGDSGALMIDEVVRSLSPEQGLLRGGGGGGGGGGHLQFTGINGSFRNCSVPVPEGTPTQIVTYLAHSSAGGGGGGGGFQIAAGRRIILSGVVNASGGDGGSGTFPPDPELPFDLAQAGGGGAGGAVLLQSQRVQIQAVPGRINISGGEGGEGTGNNSFPVKPSTGGRGSPGFLRIETPTPGDIANEKAKVEPTEAELEDQYPEDQFPGVTIEDILSAASWQPPSDAPSGWSGAQSCWIRPSGNFFRLIFQDDANVPCETGHTGAEPGWDMRLKIAGQAQPQSFRGANDFAGMPLEKLFGADFGTSPVIVRFQGARAVGTLTDPCSVPEGAGPISPTSLTEWVCHPALLNDFHRDENGVPDESKSPNIFRFVILWDRSQSDFTGIEGVEDITFTIQPD